MLSCSVVSESLQPPGLSPPCSSVHGDSPGTNTGVGCHVLLQGIFPTQASNPGFPYCRWILYHLSHQGSLWILEWVAYPFSSGSSWSRNRTGVSCIAAEFFYQLSSEGSHYSKIMSSANRNNFTSSFLFWCLFFFPCFIASIALSVLYWIGAVRVAILSYS